MSSERLAVVRLLERSDEPLSPAAVAAALGKTSGATRQLLSKMRRDRLVSTKGRGRYVVASGDVTDDVSQDADVIGDVTDDAPKLIPKPNSLRAWSLQDGGMVSHYELSRRKGYVD
jgi:IclR helix-turn-helix domain